jgi:SAM-dependent methyltransferase
MQMRPAGSCPKRMVMGPCGGVRPDGSCEVRPHPCVFESPAVWAEPVPPVALRSLPLSTGPLILTDFSSEPYSARMLTSVAATLAPSCDAVLVGEHQDQPGFPPTLYASMLLAAGLRPWMTLTCRDRNRIVLEQELTGLRQVGVDAVLCVTGDARAYDVRPDVTQVFDLDGTRLAALAASVGVTAAVVETPTAPPRHLRGFRLATKQRAGAAAAVLNHAAVPTVAAFMAAAALDWLLARLAPRAGELMIDVGAGVGGPAAYAAARTGARPVLVEPEPGACRAAVRLFHALVVQADARALPFPDACADVMWSLGVLCTTDGPQSQLAMLRELRRVSRPAGRIGLLVYVAAAPELDDPPEGNHFPTRGGLSALLDEAGLQLLDQAEAGDLPEASPEWQDRTKAVERELQRRFGGTAQLSEASKQSDRIGHLLRSGQLSCELMVARPR